MSQELEASEGPSTRNVPQPQEETVPGFVDLETIGGRAEPVTVTVPPATSTISEPSFEPSASGGSETPIGVIVGGVIGGLGLIVLVAFVLWYIRFLKRKAAGASIQDKAQPTVSGRDSMAFQTQMQPVASGDRYYPGPPPTEDFLNAAKPP